MQILRGALKGLRPRVRVAVETYRLEERSLKETAELLGISVAQRKAGCSKQKQRYVRISRTREIGFSDTAVRRKLAYPATGFVSRARPSTHTLSRSHVRNISI